MTMHELLTISFYIDFTSPSNTMDIVQTAKLCPPPQRNIFLTYYSTRHRKKLTQFKSKLTEFENRE